MVLDVPRSIVVSRLIECGLQLGVFAAFDSPQYGMGTGDLRQHRDGTNHLIWKLELFFYCFLNLNFRLCVLVIWLWVHSVVTVEIKLLKFNTF